MRWVVRLFAAVVVLAAGLGQAQQAGPRYALVIGNAAYQTPGWQLVNPVNDANLMATRLRGLGFQVTPLMNATKSQMEAAMNAFTTRVSAGGADAVGVFYYAGHGVEHDGANLLVPVDVTARSMDELRYQAPPMQFLLRDMARAGNKVNVIVLDACRNLPLPAGSRSGPAGGLADLADVPDNVLIAYATRPGLTAPDNPGESNSVFTRTLSEALASNPSDTAVNLFSQVQAKVFSATGRAQRPEFRSGLLRAPDWRFAAASGLPTTAAPTLPAFDPRQAELAYWNSCCGSGATSDDFEGYLAKVSAREFPGTYADTARRRAQALRAPPPGAGTPPSPAVSAPAVAVARPDAGGGARAPGSVIKDCAECPDMVVLPAGSFVMGSSANETGRLSNEGPQRTVRVGSFAVSRTEITFAQWDACVAGGGCGGYRPADQGWGRGNQPVINVSWNDVQSYVTWVNSRVGGQRYRLLTEAEWEYAARAGPNAAYPWGGSASHERANYGADSCCTGLAAGSDRWVNTSPAGSFPANAFGLYDMHGNVWEWVEDCYADTYSGLATDGSANVNGSCSYRVLRGGSWGLNPAWLRSALRSRDAPSYRGISIVFRLARTVF